MTRIFRFLLVLILYASGSMAASGAPNIIVSIKPFYNITAAVMQNVGKPQLLLTKNASPHDYQLKPSDAKLIDSADLVIWGGPELEGYLIKPVSSLAAKELNLANTLGLDLLPIRTSINWQGCSGHCDHDHDHSHQHGTVYDPHFWLDPDNAIIIASQIAMRLGEIDPTNAKRYEANATNFSVRMNKQKLLWKKELAAYKNDAYIVSHDAYQYFNKYFGLDGVGSITLHPEIPPSVQRIQQIQNLLRSEKVHCIFTEPQFSYKVVDTLVAGTKVHTGQLDPLGQDKDLGPNGYFVLMDNLVSNFVTCNQ